MRVVPKGEDGDDAPTNPFSSLTKTFLMRSAAAAQNAAMPILPGIGGPLRGETYHA